MSDVRLTLRFKDEAEKQRFIDKAKKAGYVNGKGQGKNLGEGSPSGYCRGIANDELFTISANAIGD